ncbi:MAG: tetratricopeptide repeat protein [Candidatus Latescibacteria bacterium]|nr:tetratricopeptide repeat protein [Candidatus Latescibacterota bacterium]
MPQGASGSGRFGPRRSGAPASAGQARYWPLLAAIVLAAALVPVLKSAHYDLVWDDEEIVGPKLEVRDPVDLWRIWNTPFDSFLGDPMRQPNYFRPLVLLTLAADHAIDGVKPAAYHRTNLMLYALACLFLWLAVWEVSRRPVAATAGAVVFALHPTHPESVCFVSGRTDLLAGALLFAALWAAARWGPSIKHPVAKLAPASALLLLACYSKEVAFLAAPVVVLALWTCDRRLKLRDIVTASAPVALACLVYYLSRIEVLGAHALPAVSPVEGAASQILTSVALVARYVPLLLFPVSLSARHEVFPLRAPDLVFGAGIVVLVALAVAVVLTLRRRSRWAIPLALVAATLVPLCYVRLIAGALMAERFLFLPSAGLAFAVALLPGSIAYFTAGVAAPLFLALLLPRVAVWKDDGSLYASMLRDSPDSPHAHSIAGSYYYRQRDFARAIEHHRRAFELRPEFTESLLNLSAAEEESGNTDSAFAHTRLLIRLRPDYAPAQYALGNLQARVDRPDSAALAYEMALKLDPNLAQAENNLGVVLERMGRIEEAIAHYRRAQELLPGYLDPANNLARLTGAAGP